MPTIYYDHMEIAQYHVSSIKIDDNLGLYQIRIDSYIMDLDSHIIYSDGENLYLDCDKSVKVTHIYQPIINMINKQIQLYVKRLLSE